jgi:hypothetical protein
MNQTTNARSFVRCSLTAFVLAAGWGCSSSVKTDSAPALATPARVTPAITAANPASMLDAVKTLEGEWVMTDDKGVTSTAAIFRVTSNGSAVREIMFPGTPHEMTNMYHMDGANLLVTHYCAMGNQPRMRAAATEGATIAFAPDSVTNLKTPADSYMGSMVMTFSGPDSVSVAWTGVKAGKPDTSHAPVFTMTRKK